MAEALGWTLRAVDVSREPLSNLNKCYQSGAGQILTTTDTSASPLAKACGREVGGAKLIEGLSMP